jgi:hypothetical protein
MAKGASGQRQNAIRPIKYLIQITVFPPQFSTRQNAIGRPPEENEIHSSGMARHRLPNTRIRAPPAITHLSPSDVADRLMPIRELDLPELPRHRDSPEPRSSAVGMYRPKFAELTALARGRRPLELQTKRQQLASNAESRLIRAKETSQSLQTACQAASPELLH